MTRPLPDTNYDCDFFAWSCEQAAALRLVDKTTLGSSVDIDHVAQEIEDMGKRDLREVASYLGRLVEHLLKIAHAGGALDVMHWRSEARLFQQSALETFSPSMRQHLDIAAIWRTGRKRAIAFLSDVGLTPTTPIACPFTLDDLLSESFDLDAALAILAATPAR